MKRNRLEKEKEYAKYFLYRENPLISILVPGKNEGKHIFKMVNSLAEQTYRNYEIIVVDDGSDDDTKLICNDLYRAGYITHYLRLIQEAVKLPPATMEPRWQEANTSYVWMPTLRSTVMRLRKSYSSYIDGMVKGVGGCVKVRNYKETICSSLQAFEYLKRIQVGRIVTSELGIYHIISGAFGAF